jgi:hypothetical protein
MKSTFENLCELCNYTTSDNTNYKKHLLTAKHKRLTLFNTDQENQENPNQTYYCQCCNFNSKNRYDFTRHNNTTKHKKISSMYQTKRQGQVQGQRQDGPPENHTNPVSASLSNDIVLELLKQNKEIQTSLVEQNKELHNTLIKISKQKTVINTTNNITNNQFNLNLFLNEECKNALNIEDFVNSLQLTVNDIEETGKLGYTQGISRIFVKALKDLDVNMRPFHCTDIKRETVYIKDQDSWEKENAEKTKLRNVLKQIARKNLKMLPEWQEQNPDFRYLDTPENEKFMQISLSSLGSEYQDEQEKMDEKIIRNVLKEVVLEKKK